MAKNIREIHLRIDVKRKHILMGEPADPTMCAIALAAREALSCRDDVEIKVIEKLIIGNVHLNLPKKAVKFIEKFDRTGTDTAARKKLKPFSLNFKLKLCNLLA